MQQFPQYGSHHYHSEDGKSLAYHRNVVLGLSITSFIFWVICAGVPAGICFNTAFVTTHFNGFLLVGVNSAYIICTFYILSLITSDEFPTPGGLKSLRSLITLFLSATVIGIAIFISSTIHYARFIEISPFDWEGNSTAFGCSFTCFWNFSMLIELFFYYRKCRTVLEGAANFGNGPTALESLGHSTANSHPMTSNEVTQIQMLTESQQHQLQQQQNLTEIQQHQLQQQQNLTAIQRHRLQQQQNVTAIQRHQLQQQQNVIVVPNSTQQENYYSNENAGSEINPSRSFVYVPQNKET
ncbi:uncharacterized protein [Palaemon carinicauda]